MKSFFNLFRESALELKNVSTIAMTGMLLAVAVILKFFSIQVTMDLRIAFTFIPIAIIAMYYGPVVCCISTFALDLIGFMLDNKTARGYSIELALIVILSGVLYGLFLYKKNYDNKKCLGWIILARASVAIVCNLVLNSIAIYTLYVNKDFSIFKTTYDSMSTFGVWVLPRVIKTSILLPIEIIILSVSLPAVRAIRKRVKAY